MKRLYIDEIQKRGDGSQPGPGRYEASKHFGQNGKTYSMAARLRQQEDALKRSGKLPGPGSYVTDNLTGVALKNSLYKTTNNFSIGKEERFARPTMKPQMNSPDSYKPLDSLNENYRSTFAKSGQAVFGKDTSSILNKHFNLKASAHHGNANPGPGQYNRFSDFSGLASERKK